MNVLVLCRWGVVSITFTYYSTNRADVAMDVGLKMERMGYKTGEYEIRFTD